MHHEPPAEDDVHVVRAQSAARARVVCRRGRAEDEQRQRAARRFAPASRRSGVCRAGVHASPAMP